VFLPVRSVGVMGDGRRYDYVVALRAVETLDFMTAHWARLPYEFLDHVSRRIVNEVARASRAWSTTSPASPRQPSGGSEFQHERRLRFRVPADASLCSQSSFDTGGMPTF
jgi:hypothetical protein